MSSSAKRSEQTRPSPPAHPLWHSEHGPRAEADFFTNAGAIAAGVSIAFVLFIGIHALIAPPAEPRYRDAVATTIEFVRTKDELRVERKNRQLPQKLDEEPPPPSELALPQTARPRLGGAPVVEIPKFDNLDIGATGPALSDTDVMPLVRIQQQYPARALSLGIEGWVLVEFTITAAGGVTDIVVIDSDPPNVFDREAIRAVSRYRYKPKVVDGVPVERSGIQLVLRWEIDDPAVAQ